jgi:hypothetical protein
MISLKDIGGKPSKKETDTNQKLNDTYRRA